MPNSHYRIPLTMVIAGVVLMVLIGVAAGYALASGVFQPRKANIELTAQARPGGTPSASAQSSGTSPLLFGTNMGLFDDHDQVITSDATRKAMEQLHIKIVRMPTRSKLSDAVNMQAAQAIKSIGAVPIVALRGAQSSDVNKVLADDTHMINVMNSVFGNSTVYYEFGNEDDWNGAPMEQYTQRWNSLVPQLKRIAPHGHFVGPVSYEYNAKNLRQFLQQANPRPDEISWHEYTCSYKDAAEHCLANLDKWSTHITDARSVMQATLGTSLPIMITEWNYAADQKVENNGKPIDDGKYNNDAFMKEWTTKAMHILAENHVFASMQYSVTNTALPMIANDGTITNQGTIFKTLYEHMIKNGS